MLRTGMLKVSIRVRSDQNNVDPRSAVVAMVMSPADVMVTSPSRLCGEGPGLLDFQDFFRVAGRGLTADVESASGIGTAGSPST